MSTTERDQLVAINLASVSVAGLFYGVFALLFGGSTYLMRRRQRMLSERDGVRRCPFRNPLLGAACAFFLAVTGNWILIVYRAFRAFLQYDGGAAPWAYYALTNRSEVAKIGCWFASLAIADCMLVYRLWVVWGGAFTICIAPALTFLASAGLCLAILVRLSTGYSLFLSETVLLEADWVCSMFTNFYCCFLIAWRIFRLTADTAPSAAPYNDTRGIYRALAIFVESAALFVGWGVLFLACYLVADDGYASFLVEDAWPPVAGIAFMLINLRVGLGAALPRPRSADPESLSESAPALTSVVPVVLDIVTRRGPEESKGSAEGAKEGGA